MARAFERLSQWWYPKEFRIAEGAPEVGLLVAQLESIHGKLAELKAAKPLDGGHADQPPPAAAALDKHFATDLCNQMHRLHRSAAKAQQQGAPEAERLQGHLAKVRASLEDQGFTYQDLSGQRYDPGKDDFEPLGEPQAMTDLRWPTIVQCERPVVLLRGKVHQKAKGVVGIPARE